MGKKNESLFWIVLVLIVVVVSVSFCIYSLYVKNQADKMNETMDSQLSADDYDASDGNYRQSEFLKLKEEYHFDLEPCDIVHLFSSDMSSSFIIKKGKNSGIELKDPVITEQGEVVGQVTKLGKNWAVVSTVWKADMCIGGYVAETDISGMVVGENKLLRKEPPMFSSLDGDIGIFVGDEILTSGLYYTFPAELLIGIVTNVYIGSAGKVDYSLIKPACYHDDTPPDRVFVIKSFDVSPAEHY